MRSPKRLYTAEHIAGGVKTVAKLQQRVLQEAPMSSGPLAQLAPPPPAAAGAEAEQPEVLAGHCLTCKTKRGFTVEGEEKMKNGAIRKYGTSTEQGCGHRVSHFVSGAQEAAA
jgi:hypothetical protein